MSDQSITLQKLLEHFGESIIESHSRLGQDTVVLQRKALLDAARLLKDDDELDYNFLMDVTAVDHLKRRPRFEVVYHFYSLQHNHRVRIKVPVGGDKPEVPTLTGLWPSANWFERETFDMFGIRFQGHPDLRRILMYEAFEGHPLRKDYPFNKRQPMVGQTE
ncbi:MAG TPA: NADH-quinone oxidoreductase subunit C [Acidobacteriota bacterium]|nr:NADH-quinone oxidoreductase subunit C [Acidobacteriota bacterium]